MQKYLMDKKLLKKTLENGLTYYIYPNNDPIGIVTISLAVKAGSAVETDEQSGIAHFIEHMCLFNYREYYHLDSETHNSIILNGYTNFDETVFNFNCFSVKNDIEKCIQICKEIINGKAVNKFLIERVRQGIINEWNATERTMDYIKRRQIFPLILNDSEYTKRMPIGKIGRITKFNYEDLMDFHRNWYKPELMSIIICGEIDPLEIEAKIIKTFSTLSNKEKNNRVYHKIEDYQSKRYTLNTYDNLNCAEIQIYYMQERYSENTISGFKQKIIENVANYLIESRTRNALKRAGLPLLNLICTKNKFLRKYAFSVLDIKIDNGIQETLMAVFEELQKIQLKGFTIDELLYCKQFFIQTINENYANSNILKTDNLAQECINEFLYDEPVLSLEDEYNVSIKFINEMTIQDVNCYTRELLSNCNSVIVINIGNKLKDTINELKIINCINSNGYY